MLDIEQIRNSELTMDPFKYSQISGLLNADDTNQLLGSLPTENNYRSVRNNGSDKTYNVVNNILLKLGEKVPNPESNLPVIWKLLINELQSPEYVTSLSELLKDDLSKCNQEITLKRYSFGDYISPHTDKSHVRATHMLFLNTDWEDIWGGNLCFMHDSSNIFKKFLPISKHSVAFVRSIDSWHSVEKITEPTAERLAIQVVFWNITKRDVLSGRIEHAVDI